MATQQVKSLFQKESIHLLKTENIFNYSNQRHSIAFGNSQSLKSLVWVIHSTKAKWMPILQTIKDKRGVWRDHVSHFPLLKCEGKIVAKTPARVMQFRVCTHWKWNMSRVVRSYKVVRKRVAGRVIPTNPEWVAAQGSIMAWLPVKNIWKPKKKVVLSLHTQPSWVHQALQIPQNIRKNETWWW